MICGNSKGYKLRMGAAGSLPPLQQWAVRGLRLDAFAGAREWIAYAHMHSAFQSSSKRYGSTRCTLRQDGSIVLENRERSISDNYVCTSSEGHAIESAPGVFEVHVGHALCRKRCGSCVILYVNDGYTLAALATPDRLLAWIMIRPDNMGKRQMDALEGLVQGTVIPVLRDTCGIRVERFVFPFARGVL